VTLDLDASMIPDGSTMEETIKGNLKYLVEVLHVDPKPFSIRSPAIALLALGVAGGRRRLAQTPSPYCRQLPPRPAPRRWRRYTRSRPE